MKSLARWTRSAQNRLRQRMNPLLLSRTCGRVDPRQTLIIAGSNRSGTTWIQETIAALPGMATVFEPCHVDAVPAAREAGFHKLIWKAPGESWPAGEAYLERILAGREWHGYTSFINSPRQCLFPRRLVVKFIHANGLLDWITNRFPLARPLALVRHPCAVISSVLNLEWNLRGLRDVLLGSELVQMSPLLQRYVRSLNTPLEQLTARWCLENAMLFRMQRPQAAHRTTYESLVLGGPAALGEVFRMWDLPAPANLEEHSQRDSRLSAHNRSYSDARNRLTAWTSQRTADETRVILRMLGEFGLDFYSADPFPDEERFARCRADGLLNDAFERLAA